MVDNKDKKEEEKYTYEYIKNDAKISIEISGDFFGRLTRLYFLLLSFFKNEEEVTKAIKCVQELRNLEDFPDDLKNAFDLQTILVLLTEINNKFYENPDMIIEKDVNPWDISEELLHKFYYPKDSNKKSS